MERTNKNCPCYFIKDKDPCRFFMEDSHERSVKEVLERFDVDPIHGLSEERAQNIAKDYGLNELPQEEPTPLYKLVLQQFDDQLVQILLLAAGVSFVLAIMDNGDSKFTAFV